MRVDGSRVLKLIIIIIFKFITNVYTDNEWYTVYITCHKTTNVTGIRNRTWVLVKGKAQIKWGWECMTIGSHAILVSPNVVHQVLRKDTKLWLLVSHWRIQKYSKFETLDVYMDLCCLVSETLQCHLGC
jgi:hypothetical protein